ncbi:MAG: hypothetical protein JRJ59_11080, partial [Deltaproteobacteria bacterium]|nr:hypothetical protein [Deltaproteobacteria bacterium]
AEMSLAGSSIAPALQDWRLKIKPGGLTVAGRRLPWGRVVLAGRLRPDQGSAALLEKIDLDVAGLGRFSGRARLAAGAASVRLRGQKISLAGFKPLLKMAGLKIKDWSLAGLADVSLRLEPGPQGHFLEAGAKFKQTAFASPEGQYLAEKLAGTVSLSTHLTGRRVVVGLALDQGDLLLDTLYLNLGRNPLAIKASGFPSDLAGPGWSRDLSLAGEMGSLGRFEAIGQIKRQAETWHYRGRLNLSQVDLGQAFEVLVKEPLSVTRPNLAGLRVEGRAELSFNFIGLDRQPCLKGRLKVSGASLSRRPGDLKQSSGQASPPPVEPETVRLVQGLDLDLPLSYRFGLRGMAQPPQPAPGEWGRLKVGLLRLPLGQVTGLDLPLVLKANRLFFGKDLSLELAGGRLDISGLVVDRPLSKEFEARLGLNLKALDLSRFSPGGLPLEGSLSGRLDRARLTLNQFEASGRLKGTVFGGAVEVANLTLKRPFSPGRMVGADIKFDRMDVERLSQALNIGRITGRISGSLTGLQVAYGQPVGFDLKVVSVKEEGVKQRVNLKAVNSIAVLGTGTGLEGLGARLMTTFFKEFSYDKIGFRCFLENDAFTIRGLIKEGGKEYLVKKPTFSGINVINRNPDNRISFADMVRRLRRVTASGQGPTMSVQ